jgi:hypothetical protein
MNGTLPKFKNLRAKRQGNCDKRKRILEAIYQSDQSEYSMFFCILLNCTYDGYTYFYMCITNISILQVVSFKIYII